MDWLILVPGALGLIVGFWMVGLKAWSLCWMTVTIVILIWETVSKFIFPEHKTISDVFRDFREKNPVYAWILLTIWILFSWSLVIHLAT